MKIDMRCISKMVSSPMGSDVFAVTFTSAVPVASLTFECDAMTYGNYALGQHYQVDVEWTTPPT
jgi:hypothetical protein